MMKQKTLRLPTKRKLNLKENAKSSIMGSLQHVTHILQAHFVQCVVLAIQRSHGTFKNASPHGYQAPCIKRQAFGIFQKEKNVNTKNRSNY